MIRWRYRGWVIWNPPDSPKSRNWPWWWTWYKHWWRRTVQPPKWGVIWRRYRVRSHRGWGAIWTDPLVQPVKYWDVWRGRYWWWSHRGWVVSDPSK